MKARRGIIPKHLPPGDPVATSGLQVRRAKAWLERTGFGDWLDEQLTAATGRPRVLAPSTLLLLLAVHALSGGDMVLTDVARRAVWLKPKQWAALGLPDGLTYENMTATLRALAKALIPIDDPARLNPKTGELHPGHWLQMPLLEFATRLLAASIPPAFTVSTDQAIDSTDHPTWARPSGKPNDQTLAESDNLADAKPASGDGRPPICADADARWGWRSKKGTNTWYFAGYDAHLLVDVAPIGVAERPALARAINLTPAGDSKTKAGIDLLDAYATAYGGYPHVLLADRGYSFGVAETWALPLQLRRVQQVFDLHKTQRVAIPDPARGCVWIGGWPYSLAMPDKLWRDEDGNQMEFPSPIGIMTDDERTQIEARYDALQAWAFRHHSYDPATGLRRFKASTVRCPAHPASLSLDYAYPTTDCTPDHCVCPPSTISVGPEWLAREQQRHPYGSAALRADYSRRVAVESFNAELKTNRASLRRATIRTLGLAKNTLLLTIYAGAVNAHMIRDAYDHHPDDRPPDTITETPRLVHRRRPRKPARHRLLKAAATQGHRRC